MTDDEFDERYDALRAALLSTWEQHAGGVPADARGKHITRDPNMPPNAEVTGRPPNGTETE